MRRRLLPQRTLAKSTVVIQELALKIMRVDAFGPPEAMKWVDHEPPALAAGQVRVSVKAAGVNRADILQRSGNWHVRTLPVFPGREAAGVISEVGPDVSGFAAGQSVLAFRGLPGCYATDVVVPVERMVPLPAGLDFATAAALPTSWLSAWYSLVRLARLERGEWLLVQGAASAVGSAAVAIARWRGAKVIGAARGAEKGAWLRQIGADEALDYSMVDVASEVRRLTGGRGADVVLDAVGGRTFGPSLQSLAYAGRCVSMANVTTEDSVVNTRDFYPKNASILGFHVGQLMEHGWDPRPDLREMMELVASGALIVHVDRTFPLEQAAEAHRYLEERRNRGNVVLVAG
jgi:NADPH2:quinone reductase